MRRILLRASVLSILFLLLFSGTAILGSGIATAQAVPATPNYANWPAADYNYQNTNNDPQSIINVNNVNQLEFKWAYQISQNKFNIPGAPPALGIETQPLVENGIVYVATPYNELLALSTTTGAQIWVYQVNMTAFIGDPWWANAYTISGLSYYNGTVYMEASDTTVYAFNATASESTGQPVIEWTLGPVAKNLPGNTGTYYGEKAPIIVGDNLIVRASTTDYGGRGFVAAYNLQTRNMSWIWFSTPPANGDPNWDADQCVSPCHGNITPYTGDWGTTPQEENYAGGGAAWGLIAVNNQTGVIYFSTGHPADGYNAALRPGPNLFTDCVIALNSTSGQMLWYYQITSHDITEHEGGWSVSLSNILVNGVETQIVTQASKDNYIYVLNAQTGNLVYPAIHVGPQGINNINDNEVNGNANLTASQSLFGNGREICPGPDGGIEMGPAIQGNMMYVVTQTACGEMTAGQYYYKGQYISGFVYGDDTASAQNATLYAINLTNGTQVWHDDLVNRYQSASAVVSGGVVYIVDRAGYVYEFNQQTGVLINSFGLGGVGAAGIAMAENLDGQMEIYVPAGGGDLPNPTSGLVYAYGLSSYTSNTGTSSVSTSSNNSGPGIQQPLIIFLGAAVVVLSMYVLLKRRRPLPSAPAQHSPAP